MTPGTYCVPRNRQEWEAILRLADSLGLLWKPFEYLTLSDSTFNSYRAVAFVDNMRFVKPVPNTECKGESLYSPEFMNVMYLERDMREEKINREAAAMNYSSGFMDIAERPKKFNVPRLTVEARLKNLEKAFDLHLQEHRELLERIASNEERSDRDHFRIDYCEPRNRIVDELGFNPDSMTGPAHRTKTVTPSKKLILTFSPEYVDADYANGATIVINPKASPTNIPFEIAIAYLKAGRKVRRDKWEPSTRVEPRGPGAAGGLRMITGASLDTGEALVSQANLLATDWMVLPE